MASPIPLSQQKPLSLTPKEILLHETHNPQSRLCERNGFVSDIALHVLSPMLEYRLRGYMEPGVFRLNHPTSNQGLLRRIDLHTPSSTIPLPHAAFLFDKQGRTILVNQPKGSLSIISKDGSEQQIATLPGGDSTHLFDAVLDVHGNIYVIDSKEQAIAVFSSEGIFQNHIVKIDSGNSLWTLTIDHHDILYVSILNGRKESRIEKYDIHGKKIETLTLPHDLMTSHLCFDPLFNRLYIVCSHCVYYYCCNENLLKEFISPSDNHYFGVCKVYSEGGILKVDIKGNVYVRKTSGEMLIFDPNRNLLSTLHIKACSTPFALTDKGELCVHDDVRTLNIFENESKGLSIRSTIKELFNKYFR